MPDPPDDHSVLDLSLFSLPVTGPTDTAEVGLATRQRPYAGNKDRFWSFVARRVDLTGPGSHVTEQPRGRAPHPPISRFSDRLAPLLQRVDSHAEAAPLATQKDGRKLNLHRQVAAAITEVTPQFFLRNISRLERDVNVRYPRYAHAVWRQDYDEYLDEVRDPRVDPPGQTHFLEDTTINYMNAERRRGYDAVLGFRWEDELIGYFKHPVRRPPPLAFYHPPEVSVWDLSLEPAPPNRADLVEKHQSTMQTLGERYDGTRDDMVEVIARKLEEIARARAERESKRR